MRRQALLDTADLACRGVGNFFREAETTESGLPTETEPNDYVSANPIWPTYSIESATGLSSRVPREASFR